MQQETGTVSFWRRVPVWVFILVGVLLVGAAGTSALLMSNRGGAIAPVAEVVTLPVPTATIDPIERSEGTAFYEALPSTILAFALSDSADAPSLLELGAIEAYRLDYTDGSDSVAVLAGQWPTDEAATAAFGEMTGAVAEAEDAGTTAGPTADPAEGGEVTVDGTVVGTWTMTVDPDGSGELTWSNGTAVLQLSGQADELRDVYSAFPL